MDFTWRQMVFDPWSQTSQAAGRWGGSIIELRSWHGTENGGEKDGPQLRFCGEKNGAVHVSFLPLVLLHWKCVPRHFNTKRTFPWQKDSVIYHICKENTNSKRESHYYSNPFESLRLIAYAVDPTSSPLDRHFSILPFTVLSWQWELGDAKAKLAG